MPQFLKQDRKKSLHFTCIQVPLSFLAYSKSPPAAQRLYLRASFQKVMAFSPAEGPLFSIFVFNFTYVFSRNLFSTIFQTKSCKCYKIFKERTSILLDSKSYASCRVLFDLGSSHLSMNLVGEDL